MRQWVLSVTEFSLILRKIDCVNS
eukprot:COSAG02_NODE_65284_length_258_cov_0.937107_1_plen_23_part_01